MGRLARVWLVRSAGVTASGQGRLTGPGEGRRWRRPSLESAHTGNACCVLLGATAQTRVVGRFCEGHARLSSWAGDQQGAERDQRGDLEDLEGDVGEVQPGCGWALAGDDLSGASVETWP